MVFSSLTTETSGNGGQFSSRGNRRVTKFIVHHAATIFKTAVLAMMRTASRQVSSNYVIKDEDIVGVVPEEYRAWTSGSAEWDGQAITVEVCNSIAGDASGWPISEASYISLAKLIADCSTRYGFAINRDNVIGHRELYTRYGASYPTACPGGINLDKLVRMANEFKQGGNITPSPTQSLGDTMYLVEVDKKDLYVVTANGYRHIKTTQSAAAFEAMLGGRRKMDLTSFWAMVQDLNSLNAIDSALVSRDRLKNNKL